MFSLTFRICDLRPLVAYYGCTHCTIGNDLLEFFQFICSGRVDQNAGVFPFIPLIFNTE